MSLALQSLTSAYFDKGFLYYIHQESGTTFAWASATEHSKRGSSLPRISVVKSVKMDETHIIFHLSSNALCNFMSNDDIDELLETWSNDDCNTNTNDSIFKKGVSSRRTTHSKTLLVSAEIQLLL
jgi:hypothetical protein